MANQRAWSDFEIKAIDEDRRIIRGIASTPTTDRVDDIVEPMGAEFTLPIPFLWQHESRESSIGDVVAAAPTADGIPVEIHVQSDDEPGILKDRLDYAWRSIKKKLVRGLSIGFRSLDDEPIKGSFGTRFKRWEWLELSAVTIPANPEAVMTSVKSVDAPPAAPGHTEGGTASSTPPGASGLPVVKLIKPKPAGGTSVNIAEQITSFENTRAAKAARRLEIQEACGKEGRSKNEAEREETQALTDEITSIDAELKDLHVLEKEALATAKPVNGTGTKAASESRAPAIVKAEPKLEKGIAFARFAMCVYGAKGDPIRALNLMQRHYPSHEKGIAVLKAARDAGQDVGNFIAGLAEMRTLTKANVPAGTTDDATWASPLVAHNDFAGDFIEYLRPRTIIGQFGQNGIPALHSIPFNVHVKGETSGGTGYWVGEGKPKPVTKFDYNDTYHAFTKVASISVLTEELVRFSNPSAERLVRDALGRVLRARMDADFIDPAITATTGVRPASITNGVTAITSSGTDADAVRADIGALFAEADDANQDLESAVFITTPSIARHLGLMRNALGQKEFDDVTMKGGRLEDVPVIVSNYVPAGTFILVFADEIYFSDDGDVTVDASREASLQMLDNPTNDSDTPTPTTLVSMFQTDSVALRAHRFVHWSKRRDSAVALLEDVGWGGAAAS